MIIYLGIGTVIIIIGVVAYLIYRKQTARPSVVSDSSKENIETVSDSTETAPEAEKTVLPIISESASLPEDAKLQLMNAVWYRCENPYCNYTGFLDVHHIISEAKGGSNRLNNLIVLCPKCRTAAHRHEITEKELLTWVLARTERFKTELDWPYK